MDTSVSRFSNMHQALTAMRNGIRTSEGRRLMAVSIIVGRMIEAWDTVRD